MKDNPIEVSVIYFAHISSANQDQKSTLGATTQFCMYQRSLALNDRPSPELLTAEITVRVHFIRLGMPLSFVKAQ